MMGRRFAFCPTCKRFSWARTDRKTGRVFYPQCGDEILQNITKPQVEVFTRTEDHFSSPEVNQTRRTK